ncbi:MAG: hypothetical protein ACR2KU_13690 [Gammaproteobacteria bacterium]
MVDVSTSSEKEQRGHESDVIDARAVIGSGLALLIVTVLCMWIAYAWIDFSAPERPRIATSERSAAEIPGQQPQPSRGLPGTPVASAEALATSEAARLRGYRWIDERTGRISIPIERAMDIVAEQGLPRFDQRAPRSGRAP